MTFDEILDHAIEMLQRRGRVSYRVLKIQFDLSDDHLEALKDELIEVHQLAVDQDGKVLVWTRDAKTTSPTTAPPSTQPEVVQEAQPVQVEPSFFSYRRLRTWCRTKPACTRTSCWERR